MENKLTAKQQLFVDYYLVDLNATQAAKKAGYSERNADKIGPELLGKTRVKAAIQKAMDERSQRTKIDADYVLKGIQGVIERCEQAEPVLDREGNPTGEYTFQAASALKGYELLGKHLKLFTDKVEVSADESLVERLAAARERIKQS